MDRIQRMAMTEAEVQKQTHTAIDVLPKNWTVRNSRISL